MSRTSFMSGWSYRREGEHAFIPVELPHDAMIGERRSASAGTWAHGGYFPGGHYRYRRSFIPGAELEGQHVSLSFEGIYGHARVMLDGRELGAAVNGYQELTVRLDPYLTVGRSHLLEVEADNTRVPNSRWYTGSGIYRPVWLEVRDQLHVERSGVALTTRFVDDTVVVDVDVPIVNLERRDVDVELRLERGDSVVAHARVPSDGAGARVTVAVPDAELWSAESPALHGMTVLLTEAGRELDRVESRVGLRVVELKPGRGLVVNGRVVTLRGANVHHDNGVLGAATFPAAERRRVRLLKEAGFNAIRSAHNPASRALLAACDEVGMYVVDEAFDGWYDHKTQHDDAEQFDTVWRGALSSMVGKDRLHPSVIMYSIGNENGEAFTPRGRRAAAAMADELRHLDPTRLTTIGVNLVGAAFAGIANSHEKETREGPAKAAPDMTSTSINAMSNRFGFLMSRFPRWRSADRSTRDLFSLVDVAGYNYGTSRYEIDAELHPDRMFLGTESMAGDLARNVALARAIPALIGDFVWAGWDYIGEAGGGAWAYGTRRAPFLKPYPQLTSQMGIFDITGVPGAAIRLAQAAWGTLHEPAIAVRPLDVQPGSVARSSWRSTDALESWSWAGHEGDVAELEVYSVDDEVEVFVNGRSLGRRPAGAEHGFLARFRTRYEPGSVEAIGYRAGQAASRSELRSAGAPRLQLVAEGPLAADPADVTFVRIELADPSGVVDTAASDNIVVRVDGPAVVAGFGSGAPASDESFTDLAHSTYRGRALLALRGTRRLGQVTLIATSQGHGAAELRFEVTDRTTATTTAARREGQLS